MQDNRASGIFRRKFRKTESEYNETKDYFVCIGTGRSCNQLYERILPDELHCLLLFRI